MNENIVVISVLAFVWLWSNFEIFDRYMWNDKYDAIENIVWMVFSGGWMVGVYHLIYWFAEN